MTAADRFARHVDKSGGCWIWTASRNARGYGYFDHGYAHRFSYTTFVEAIPAGAMVLHRCDNPPCVRPDHLFVGDAADNARDRDSKGRANTPKGATHGMAKLTPRQAWAIRVCATLGDSTMMIARWFGISEAQVSRIRNGSRWRTA